MASIAIQKMLHLLSRESATSALPFFPLICAKHWKLCPLEAAAAVVSSTRVLSANGIHTLLENVVILHIAGSPCHIGWQAIHTKHHEA